MNSQSTISTPDIDTSVLQAQEPQGVAALSKDKTQKRTAIFGGDKHLWGIYLALCVISIVELYSASSREVASSTVGVYGPILRHFLQLVGGFVVVVVVQRIHYGKFAYAIPYFAILSVLMMVYVLFFGESVNGASRSFNFIISIQPSEFLKISAVAMIALVMAMTQNEEDNSVRNRGMWITIGIMTLFASLLIRDGLTNTAILMAISLAMMLIGGINIKNFTILVAVYIALGIGGYQLAKHYHLGRFDTWAERVDEHTQEEAPYKRALTPDNQQEMYSQMAIANGGIFGVGPGNSRETSRLPLAFSDFIYSIIIEDLGMVGGIVVLVLFLWLLARASGIAGKCTNCFANLLLLGMAVFVVTQALTHMAINVGLVPVTGQPLPLISKGGTSILITSLAFGVMLSVSRHATGKKSHEVKDDMANVPEQLRAANPSALD